MADFKGAERAIPTSDPSWKFVAFQKKASRPRGPGRWAEKRRNLLVLTRQQQACETCGVDVAEQRGTRRQEGRVQEAGVKVVAAARRAVYHGAALEGASSLAVEIEADDGTTVIELGAAQFSM